MRTKDRIKEEIGLDKLLMTILSAMASSMIGWLFYNLALSPKAIAVLSVVFVFLTFTIFILFQIKIKIKELDNDR